MTNNEIWAAMDNDERNLRLAGLRNRALAAFVATTLPTVMLIGIWAVYLGGFAAVLAYWHAERKVTRSLRG